MLVEPRAMTEDELIEKMARAMCDTWGYLWDGEPNDEQTAPETCVDIVPGKSLYREAARAALAAIREALQEPTDAMIDAGDAALFNAGDGDLPASYIGPVWKAMLSASPLKGET
jgi:hypothetical protein